MLIISILLHKCKFSFAEHFHGTEMKLSEMAILDYVACNLIKLRLWCPQVPNCSTYNIYISIQKGRGSKAVKCNWKVQISSKSFRLLNRDARIYLTKYVLNLFFRQRVVFRPICLDRNLFSTIWPKSVSRF